MKKATNKNKTTAAHLLPVPTKKQVYPTHPLERQIIKHYQNFQLYQRWTSEALKNLKIQGYRGTKDHQNSLFYDGIIDFTTGQQLANKEAQKIAAIEAKGINLQQALHNMYLLNLSQQPKYN